MSPDGRTGVRVLHDQGPEEADLPVADVVEVWELRGKPSLVRRLVFPLDDPRYDEIVLDAPAFEDDGTFVARAYEPESVTGYDRTRSFALRCTLEGACERATRSTRRLVWTVDDSVYVAGRFDDS